MTIDELISDEVSFIQSCPNYSEDRLRPIMNMSGYPCLKALQKYHVELIKNEDMAMDEHIITKYSLPLEEQ